VVTGGGFISEDQADSNDKSLNLDNLKATHEEADMRMLLHMLHCKKVSNYRTIAVSATDTDVFLLLLHHAYGMDIKIWMMAGTSKSPENIPIHSVLETNLPTRRMAQNLLAFHSITGCDTTSFFYGISKKKAYKVYEQDVNLLEGIGEAELTDEKIKLAEVFICKLYNQVTDTSDEARDLMFGKSKSPESLPPTSDALKLHIERAHFQASVWKQANVVKPVLPSPVTMGWSLDGDRLIPLLMTLDPVPQACLEMISCQCSTGCITLRCSCKKAKLPCTDLCKCHQSKHEQCVNSRI
jgi:hypothetical protein